MMQMVAPNDDDLNKASKEYLAYSAGFFDGVEQQSVNTLNVIKNLLSDDIPAKLQDDLKELYNGKIRQLINTQVIIDLLEDVQNKIENACFICGEDKSNDIKVNKRVRPICNMCYRTFKMQFPEEFL